MNNKKYLKHEIDQALKEHDHTYKISVKFNGSKNNSRNLDLTFEELQAVYKILTGEVLK